MGETADVIRLAFERINARDVRGFADLCSPRIEWREVPEIPGAGVYKGPDEVADRIDDLLGVSDRIRFVNWSMIERGETALIDMSVEMESSRGMDMGWSADPAESFRIFQSKVLREYDDIVAAHDIAVIDATDGITEQQQLFRELVSRHLEGARAS